jgi:hypothetical protein
VSDMTGSDVLGPTDSKPIREAMLWGVVVGGVLVLLPLGFWWLEAATVHALAIAAIASVYVGFAVADGRPRVIAVETSVATVFILIAAAAVTGSAWLLVVGYVGHGCKDFWQHRNHYVANTRWWPPFCVVADWVAAAVIAIEIAAGMNFHH